MRFPFFIIMGCLLSIGTCANNFAGGIHAPIPGGTYTSIPGGTYASTKDGVIVYPDPFLSGNALAIKLQVVSDNIIRVTGNPAASPDALPGSSLITVYAPDSSARWTITTTETQVVLTTRLITASVMRSTGAVTFRDSSGRELLAEKAKGGHELQAAIFDGEPSWHIRQTFTLHPDEALYGLGQHQDGRINHKGQEVTLFQNNTEVAVPFLLSNRNYGLLWDNYSITDVGDIRPYRPLSAMKLFSKEGRPGWLTASYCNDRKEPDHTAFEKAESIIDYAYLGDTRDKLPSEFKIASGQVTWEGALASDFTGVHSFRCSYAGYIKVWIDGKLLLDRWRQAWNPATVFLELPMQKDKKYPVRIEWIPDGQESYLSLKWKDPVAESEQDDFSFSSQAGRGLDYYFIYGENMDRVIAGYRELTGRCPLVPKWAMGLWQSRERYKTQDEVLQTVAEFRKRKIPLDNIVLDWSYWRENDWGSQDFDATRFPSPDSMIHRLHDDYHTHFMISVWPKFYEGIPIYHAFDQNGWLFKRNIADRQRDWIGKGYVSTFYDAFNKGARQAFWDLLNKKLYTKGIDAWWMDASEPDILSNVPPEKRMLQMTPTALGPAAEYLNAYPLENAKGIYEGQRETDTSKRVFILTRSAFAGSQHYAAAVWSGDIAARWSDMQTQIAAGIGFSMSGIPYWTMDIGGFSVEHRFENAKGKDLEEWREQMTRWYQFGSFCPLFRVHGQYPYREIFNTAPEDHPAYKSMLYYDRLRYRLLPYIYSLAAMVSLRDYTIMRGLAMDFPADTAVYNIGDQYMFGPGILVNPVYTPMAVNREVYLPAGQGWYDLYTGKYWPGGRRIMADAPYERMPLFVKEGSILPIGPDLQYSNEKPADPITLYVYTGKNATFTLYEDEGTNYNYEKGAYTRIPFTYDQSTGVLTIGARQGGFKGMLPQRTFQVQWISKDHQQPLDGGISPVPIRYKGVAITIQNPLINKK